MMVYIRILVILAFWLFYSPGYGQSIGFDTNEFSINKSEGIRYSHLRISDSAVFYFNKALQYAPMPDSMAVVFLKLGDEYRINSDFTNSIKYCDSVEFLLNKFTFDSKEINFELLHLKGKIYADKGDYNLSLGYFDDALNILENSNLDVDRSLPKVFNYRGITKFYLGKFDAALDDYSKGFAIASQNDDLQADLADIAQNIGILFIYKGDFDSAVRYLEISKVVRESIYDDNDPKMASFYSNYGRILGMVGRVNESLQLYQKAEKIMINTHDDNNVWWGHLMLNIGNYMQLSSDYNKAMLYYQNAKSVYDRVLEPDHPMVVTAANNLANIYIHFSDFKQALDMGLSTLEKARSPITRVQLMRNIARSYLGLGDTSQAMNYIHQALQTALNDLGESHFETANSYVFLAETEMLLENFNEAYNHYAEAKKIFADIFSFNDTEVSDVLLKMAICKMSVQQFKVADELLGIAEKVGDQDIVDTKTSTSSLISIRLVDIYFWWGTLYHRWFAESKDISKLKNALAYFQKAMALYNQLGYAVSDESRLLLNQNAKIKFNEAVDVAYALYKNTGNPDYIDVGFAFAEKSKSAVLLSIMRKSEALIGAGVSQKMADQDHKLREEIAAIQKLIYEEHQKSFPNQNRINYLQTRQLSLVNSYDSLIGAIKSSFPDYYRLAFDNRVVDLVEVQQGVDSDQHVIEYVLGDSALVIFNISKDNKDMVRITEEIAQIRPAIQQLVDQLNPDFSNLRQSDMLSFAQTSGFLYHKLVAAIQNDINGKRLLIIPDGVLGYLPFELLITAPADATQGFDYGKLNFLMLQHAISYDYSATLRFGELFQNNRGNGQVLAVVPDYQQFGNFEDISGNSITLQDLPYAMLEAQKTLKIADGDLLAGANATKARFEKEAKKYSILHLAMHTIIDDENPLYSRLVFQQTSDSLDAFTLGTYELFGLKLNADLAVLSACKTGSGKLMQGEGVMSMTRGFVYAGVNAIVMTNWEVHDQSGAQLMQLFYQYLADGETKDIAIQKARIDFLQTANNLKSHPYFWASYMLIGDAKPINLHHKSPAIFEFMIIAILFGGMLVWANTKYHYTARRKKRKSASE